MSSSISRSMRTPPAIRSLSGMREKLDSTALINKLLARQTPHLTVHQEESRHLLTDPGRRLTTNQA